jgi:hypothetical protein
LLLDLADAAPSEPQARAAALQVLEQPLAEILGSRAGLADLLGADLDLGEQLAAMTRMAGADSVEALIQIDPKVARIMPTLPAPAARLAGWLSGPGFESGRVGHRPAGAARAGRPAAAQARRRRRRDRPAARPGHGPDRRGRPDSQPGRHSRRLLRPLADAGHQ